MINKKIQWKILPFELITINDLYDILALREEVFALEQKCTAIDLDGLDKRAIHVIGKINEQIMATARILPPNVYLKDKVSFGRLAIKKHLRGKGFGDELMDIIFQYIKSNFPGIPIEFSAQLYLKTFYEKHGCTAFGAVYDDGGIPHIYMKCL
jgi:ElaA protein